MPSSREVQPQIPYLRRFARALVGDQEGGDRLVERALRALLGQPALLEGASSLRIGLFRLLLANARARGEASTQADLQAPEAGGLRSDLRPRALGCLAPAARQAFLLKALEGFRLEQVAEAMGLDQKAAARLIDQASCELSGLLTTTVLIIEDEPVIALDLEAMVEGCGHRVAGIASTRREALELARARPPGLVLADVQLADKSSGLDAVNDLLAEFSVPVIFITAYPERLLSGKRPEPTFVVTKPFSATTVLALISQALFFEQVAHRRDRAVA